VTLPNFITIARLLSVPLILWLMISDQFAAATIVFVISGLSDAIDGFIAKRYGLVSHLGSFLDPLADKALLVSVFVALGAKGVLPPWLIVLVVSRDVLIIGAVVLSWIVGEPIAVKPLWVSKANTVAQILLVGVALAGAAGVPNLGGPLTALIVVTAVLTVLSAAAYLVTWVRHMARAGAAEGEGGT